MIQIKNFSFSYGKKDVIQDLSIDFQNYRYVLLGNNGCGKTTFFRCLSGYYRWYKGDIYDFENTKIRVGYLPQKFGMYKGMTVQENLEYLAILKGYDIKKDVLTVIEQTNLNDFAQTKTELLSGGMLQRLGIAQAIMGSPNIVLLDEPTAGLDIKQRKNFYTIINNLNIDAPIVISTHNIDDAKEMAEIVIVMKNKKMYVTDWNPKSDNLEEKYLCFQS